jgi:coatomer subunit beta'
MFLSLLPIINTIRLLYTTLITVTSAKFIAHKQWIMAGCSSGLIYVYGYDPEKKNPVEKIRVLRGSNAVNSLAVHSTEGHSNPINSLVVHATEGHSNAVNSLAVHATEPCVLSASKDGKILIWDYENEWKLVKTFDVKSPVQHVAFSPKHTNMFASAQDKTVKVCLVFIYIHLVNMIMDVPIKNQILKYMHLLETADMGLAF